MQSRYAICLNYLTFQKTFFVWLDSNICAKMPHLIFPLESILYGVFYYFFDSNKSNNMNLIQFFGFIKFLKLKKT